MVCQIQKFLSEGCSYREIAKRMGVGRNTIAKYREGDPEELSMYGIRQSKLDIFYDFIIQCLDSGWSKSKTIKEIYAKGYTGSKSNAFEYLCKVEQKENKYFEAQPYIRTMTEGLKYRTGSIGKEKEQYEIQCDNQQMTVYIKTVMCFPCNMMIIIGEPVVRIKSSQHAQSNQPKRQNNQPLDRIVFLHLPFSRYILLHTARTAHIQKYAALAITDIFSCFR